MVPNNDAGRGDSETTTLFDTNKKPLRHHTVDTTWTCFDCSTCCDGALSHIHYTHTPLQIHIHTCIYHTHIYIVIGVNINIGSTFTCTFTSPRRMQSCCWSARKCWGDARCISQSEDKCVGIAQRHGTRMEITRISVPDRESVVSGNALTEKHQHLCVSPMPFSVFHDCTRMHTRTTTPTKDTDAETDAETDEETD